MPGIVPDEGEQVFLDLALGAENVSTFNTNTDRGADLELGLFTNSSISDTTTLSSIVEPTGGGYARITLTDGSWTSANPMTYAVQQFSPSGAAYSGSVQGYFIATKPAGTGTARLLIIEDDTNGPYTLNDGDTYDITPQISSN